MTFLKKLVSNKLKIFLASLASYLIAMLIIVFSGLKENLNKAQLIVVLGTTVSPEGIPSPRLVARLDKTIEIYKQGYAPLIFVSGGTGKDGFDESLAMANYLIEQGIPKHVIVQDGKGNNTKATARNVALYMKHQQLSSVIIVSQYFHIARTKLAFQHVGIQHINTASPLYFEWRDSYSILREVIGYPVYMLNIR